MNRESIPVIVVGVLCALAVIFAAATIADTTNQTGGGPGTGEGNVGSDSKPVDAGTLNKTRDPVPQNRTRLPEQKCSDTPGLNLTPMWLLPMGALLLFGAYTYRKQGRTVAILSLVILLGPVLFGSAYLLSGGVDEACQERNQPTQQPALNGSNGSVEDAAKNASKGGGGGGPPQFQLPMPILALVAIMLIGLAIAGAMNGGRIGSAVPEVLSGPADPEEDLAEEEADRDALGRAAGRAADRIESGTDVENEVYRAWVEMTRHLEIDHPHSSTPAEFAAAAVDAGLDPDDVDELTAQFEAVRYGGEDPTGDRERRAVEALRRIEAEYADDGEAGDPE